VVIGEGVAGPHTRRLQDCLLGVARGVLPDSRGWRTLVRPSVQEVAAA